MPDDDYELDESEMWWYDGERDCYISEDIEDYEYEEVGD